MRMGDSGLFHFPAKKSPTLHSFEVDTFMIWYESTLTK